MVGPLKEISQEEVGRMVSEWDVREPDPSHWAKADGVELPWANRRALLVIHGGCDPGQCDR